MSKFVILHAPPCPVIPHYRIRGDGSRLLCMNEDEPGVHRGAIAIGVDASFLATTGTDGRLDALRELLLELRLRYPSIRLGGHRQVRGSGTDCPGRAFPLPALEAWWDGPMLAELDERRAGIIAAAYGPRLDQ